MKLFLAWKKLKSGEDQDLHFDAESSQEATEQLCDKIVEFASVLKNHIENKDEIIKEQDFSQWQHDLQQIKIDLGKARVGTLFITLDRFVNVENGDYSFPLIYDENEWQIEKKKKLSTNKVLSFKF